ncbi:MAG: helix-turn-helix transcriptional regulator [Fimbriimonadaceae bacterium]|nr:MAG: helix-turn-helix transcriptional regulator [Fimbriimonadaceae bacterium]
MTINSEKPNTSGQQNPQPLSDVRLPLASTLIAQKAQSNCSVELITGVLNDPMYSFQQVDLSQSLILHSISGSAVCQFADGSSMVITPGTTVEICASLRSVMVYGRGTHEWLKISKPISSALSNEPNAQLKIINQLTRPCAIFEQLTTALMSKVRSGLIEGPYLGAWLHFIQECPSTLYERPYLTNCIAPKNENIAKLLDEIRNSPDQYWSLSIAAEKAGYSNFHLSRIFHTEVGMGFPEFVERARTEIAIQSLLTTLIPINQVTQLSGFGSSPTLRSACQEYTGFLPSELRGAAGE